MASLADPAVDVLANILKSSDTDLRSRSLRLRVAQDVLDRAGLKSVDRVEPYVHRIDPRDLTDEQLRAVLNLREQLAKGPRRQP